MLLLDSLRCSPSLLSTETSERVVRCLPSQIMLSSMSLVCLLRCYEDEMPVDSWCRLLKTLALALSNWVSCTSSTRGQPAPFNC